MKRGQSHPAWLDRLEREAAERLDGKMLSFSGGEYACPWLRWYFRRHRNCQPDVVVILQDWGLGHGERVSIEAAVHEISSPGGNRTSAVTVTSVAAAARLRKRQRCAHKEVVGPNPLEGVVWLLRITMAKSLTAYLCFPRKNRRALRVFLDQMLSLHRKPTERLLENALKDYCEVVVRKEVPWLFWESVAYVKSIYLRFMSIKT